MNGVTTTGVATNEVVDHRDNRITESGIIALDSANNSCKPMSSAGETLLVKEVLTCCGLVAQVHLPEKSHQRRRTRRVNLTAQKVEVIPHRHPRAVNRPKKRDAVVASADVRKVATSDVVADEEEVHRPAHLVAAMTARRTSRRLKKRTNGTKRKRDTMMTMLMVKQTRGPNAKNPRREK